MNTTELISSLTEINAMATKLKALEEVLEKYGILDTDELDEVLHGHASCSNGLTQLGDITENLKKAGLNIDDRDDFIFGLQDLKNRADEGEAYIRMLDSKDISTDSPSSAGADISELQRRAEALDEANEKLCDLDSEISSIVGRLEDLDVAEVSY